MPERIDHIQPGADGASVVILDQRALPLRREYLTLRSLAGMREAVQTLAVRGAPALGIFAGFALAALAAGMPETRAEFDRAFSEAAASLAASRPTAVNLGWACRRMQDVLTAHPTDAPAALRVRLAAEAQAILDEDIARCHAISEHGLALLRPGDGVLTHCNAGPIATSRYGTALGPILLGLERGLHFRVFADETRPLLQGARLTSWELRTAGADVTLICDNMASMVMKNGWVQACFVGCDRIAANGDFANKIGTSGVAILAKHYGIPVYTLGPTSTIDMNCPDGAHIPIELRDGDEIKNLWYEKPMALPEVKCFNPSFDVTDHKLLTGIVTEKGICYPPFNESLAALFKDKK